MGNPKEWNFITTQGLVLLYIYKHSQCTTREIASELNITERTVHSALKDLYSEGYINWRKKGRNNVYQVYEEQGLRHDTIRDVVVGDLMELLRGSDTET